MTLTYGSIYNIASNPAMAPKTPVKGFAPTAAAPELDEETAPAVPVAGRLSDPVERGDEPLLPPVTEPDADPDLADPVVAGAIAALLMLCTSANALRPILVGQHPKNEFPPGALLDGIITPVLQNPISHVWLVDGATRIPPLHDV